MLSWWLAACSPNTPARLCLSSFSFIKATQAAFFHCLFLWHIIVIQKNIIQSVHFQLHTVRFIFDHQIFLYYWKHLLPLLLKSYLLGSILCIFFFILLCFLSFLFPFLFILSARISVIIACKAVYFFFENSPAKKSDFSSVVDGFYWLNRKISSNCKTDKK